MPRGLIISLLIAGAIFAASLGGLIAIYRSMARAGGSGGGGGLGPGGSAATRSADPLLPDDNAKDLRILPFELTDQNGVKTTNDVFTGKLTVVSFVFTNCTLVCPMLTQTMGDLARDLRQAGGPGAQVRFLSISVDPIHDTPERLAQYARDRSADPTRWTFAVGPTTVVYPMLEQGLKFAVGTDPSDANIIKLPSGGTMNNIIHPSWFVLVGPKGEVLGIYLASVPEEMAALKKRAAAGATKLGLK